jgi:ATP dependent DNA ligase domain
LAGAPPHTKNKAAPAFVTLMAALSVTKLPEGPEWLYEVKWDGYRALVLKDGPRIQIRSRNDNDFSLKYWSVAEAALQLKADQATLDGEIVALGPDGRPSYPDVYQHWRTAWPYRSVDASQARGARRACPVPKAPGSRKVSVYEVIRPGRLASDYPSSSRFLNSNFTAKGSDYRKRDVRD